MIKRWSREVKASFGVGCFQSTDSVESSVHESDLAVVRPSRFTGQTANT